MPPVSEKQRRAMEAAAHGHSTLDIPRAVGEEFVGKDAVEASQIAAGVIFIAPDGAVLLLCRSSQEANYAGHWALPGGKGEPGEAPWEIACREACEEIGAGTEHAWIGEPTVVDEIVTPTGMSFTTFVQPVRYRFTPELDAEHSGFVWAEAESFPAPMHPQVARVLAMLFPEGQEEMAAAESDAASDSVAMDRASVRTKDADGHLRVDITPISKANICPYYGREIPGWQSLGLDPEKAYNLYRDAEELAKGAETFGGKPVLLTHKATKAADHPREIVVGAVGDGVVFDPPYLKAPLTIWDGEAIDLIESGEQRELSSSYRYVPVMTPGVGPDGQRYDGRMTEIVGNHVALVEKGRAGEDVLVQDNLPAGLAATTPNSGIPAGGVKRAAAHDEEEPAMADKTAKDRAKDEAGLMERVKEKLSAEDWKALDEMMAAKANDEDKEDEKKAADEEEAKAEEKGAKATDKAKDKAKDKAADEDDDEDDKADDEEESVSKEAMDAALKSAIAGERKEQAAIRDAERFVRPWVGDLAVAFDSAPEVYKAAIEHNGRSVAGIDPSAYRAILEMIPKPGQQRHSAARLAMDSTKSNGFAERYPEAAKVAVSLR